jgi:hypothetical protein
MKHTFRFLGFILLAFVFAGCGDDSSTTDKTGNTQTKTQQRKLVDSQFYVRDLLSQKPISAQVLIGNTVRLQSGVDGIVAAPANWQSPQPLTVSATGYLLTTWTDQLPEGQTFYIRTAELTAQRPSQVGLQDSVLWELGPQSKKAVWEVLSASGQPFLPPELNGFFQKDPRKQYLWEFH